MQQLTSLTGPISLADQGRALCALPPTHDAPALCLALPFLTLRIDADCPEYAALCQRALVDHSPPATLPTAPLHITVTDHQTRPDLVLPQFDAEKAGLGALIAACEAEEINGCYDSMHKIWQFLDPVAGRGVQIMQAAGAMPLWERAFPLRNFLHWAYAAQGRRLLHAGSLGHHGKGILLAGAGGAGKSGTTLAGVMDGLQSVGDDYIVVGFDKTGPQAFPVMRLMKQDRNGLARLGLDPSQFGPLNWQGKHEFDVTDISRSNPAQRLSINAIILPQITGALHSRLRPATAHDVLFALLPNNLQQLPGQTKQAMSFLARLTRELPGYHLELGSDPHEISFTIRDFLERGAL